MRYSVRLIAWSLMLGLGLVVGGVLLTEPVLAQEDVGFFAEPSTFQGAVLVEGEVAPDGAVIDALVRGLVCGEGVVEHGRYAVTVRAGGGQGDDYQKGCGGGGDEVSFRIGDLVAHQTGTFFEGTIQTLSLTFGAVAGLAFYGTVTLNGEPAPDGMPIELRVVDNVCGETVVRDGRHVIALEAREGCLLADAGVSFHSGELKAAEQSIVGGGIQELDLTFSNLPDNAATPVLPSTGFGESGTSATVPTWLLWALIVGGLAALGAAARRA